MSQFADQEVSDRFAPGYYRCVADGSEVWFGWAASVVDAHARAEAEGVPAEEKFAERMTYGPAMHPVVLAAWREQH
ncbi:hypothetical protein [Eleftheria terrae]|uniref:hypothetical protein n=1 Tax=Eleftheria terrae TaxID=1597781 RepID=UPI00263AC30D|nr:hypothetical protein [Eleftheria terrae]WKB50536.1 hypothetical protein N7L95_00010 [Eleftheria terrae]